MEDPDVNNEPLVSAEPSNSEDADVTNEHYEDKNDDKDLIESLKHEIEALKKKLAEAERERDEERKMRLALRRHAIRLGQALKACRELALEKGVDLAGVRDSAEDAAEAVNSSATDVHTAAVPREVSRGGGMSTPALKALQADAKKDGWLIQPEEVELLDQLGHGATADIYRAQWHGFEVAVKCLRPKCFGASTDSVDVFVREVEVLSKQRHPYILHLFGACLDPPEHAWIVTECMRAGTLMEWLHGSKKRDWKRTIPLPPLETRLRIATEISIGMQYLHERKPLVMHRDLKPSNIFLDENLHVRIADFSFSRYKTSDHDIYTGETGTYLYMAPEVMRHEYYTEKCDVYSFGIMLCELVTGNPPYIDDFMTPVQIACGVAEGSLRPTLPEDVKPPLRSLITKAWDQTPSKRPTFAEITATLKIATAEAIERAAIPPAPSAGEHLHEHIHGLFLGLRGKTQAQHSQDIHHANHKHQEG